MILDRFKLGGRVAVITGAGKGIGRGCALALAEMGAHVVCAARTQADIELVAEEARRHGVRALAVPCDVLQAEQLEALSEAAVEEFGRIDILINNAGGSPPKPLLETSDRMFEHAFHFNVTTAFSLSRLVVPTMLKGDGGAIVNIASVAGRLVSPGFAAYGTAKAALIHLTRELACELAPRIRVNAIGVGSTLTDALSQFLDAETKAKMEAMTPLGRLGEVEDIALCALYLASPASSYVTGKLFDVDGGLEAMNWPFEIPSP